MPLQADSPVIYLTFANEQRGSPNMFLRNLKVERDAIREMFEDAEMDSEVELITDPDVTQTQIYRTFQGKRYRDKISIFHYGGHADSDELFFEADEGGNQSFYTTGLAALLGQQESLKLVFLNGCATREQADGLLKAGVPVVIATSRKIADDDATLFSKTFYRGISGNATIARAFKEAESALLAQHGSLENFRAVYWDKEVADTSDPKELPWKLFYQEENSIQWSLFPDEQKGTGMSLVDVKSALIGKEVGSYVITEFINIGNFGFVFRAKHKSLNKEAAIKVSHRIVKGYDKLKDIIETGAKGLSLLNHINIARTEDMGEYSIDKFDKRFYVTMEIVNGKRLDQIDTGIKTAGRTDFKRVLSPVLQILDGLQFAHEVIYEDSRGFRLIGVMHGNIKTRKIMMDNNSVPKIIDFMVADLARQNEVEIEFPEELKSILKDEKPEDYFSPEQISGGVISITTDIYSAGAVLFELFSGKKVSEVSLKSPADVAKYFKMYNSAIPSYLGEVVFKALRPLPQERFQSVRAMRDAIINNLSWWSRLMIALGFRKF
ncbi:MAG: protein kinase [Bacteroidia bacterium]|nr:protein kinase [Bacteroidia bacterium]